MSSMVARSLSRSTSARRGRRVVHVGTVCGARFGCAVRPCLTIQVMSLSGLYCNTLSTEHCPDPTPILHIDILGNASTNQPSRLSFDVPGRQCTSRTCSRCHAKQQHKHNHRGVCVFSIYTSVCIHLPRSQTGVADTYDPSLAQLLTRSPSPTTPSGCGRGGVRRQRPHQDGAIHQATSRALPCWQRR